MDVGGWLRDLGIGRYEQTFIEKNAIDSDVLPELTEDDLEKLGIPLGDRKRLIKAIRGMLADSPSALITSAVGEDVQSGQPRAAAAERRHLTVMICDVVGSTALSTRLDPEDMSAVMDAYHAACARITRTYDGFLAEFRGDGILAYFGYPIAHEDDAERTVRAGLDIIAALAQLETRARCRRNRARPGGSRRRAEPGRRDRQHRGLLLRGKGCGARLWHCGAIWSQRAADGIMARAWRWQRFAAGGIRELQMLRHPNG